MALHVDDLALFLDELFEAERFEPEERGGVYRPSERPIRRLGLALEPWPELLGWVRRQRLDALWLHRPWRLAEEVVDGVGVVSHHLPFDEKLTTGYNTRLADTLGVRRLEVLGRKRGRPIGMLGDVRPLEWEQLVRSVSEAFGGVDLADAGGQGEIARVAVVGAMSDAVVREAARRGAQAYLTGEWREPGARAVTETGIGVICIGHRRSEEWGMRALAAILGERWAGLECVVRRPAGR